jgi:TRAP-type C4-dicarboxylate transport system substrate-binding protein
MKRLCAALLLLAGILLPVVSRADEPIHLKLAFFGPDTEMTFVTTLKPFADAVNKDAGGLIQIDTYPNGALGRSLPNQPQMVLDGVADIAFAIPGNTPGRFPDDTVVELPGMFRDIREATLAWTKLMATSDLRGFGDYVVLGALGTAPFSIHTRTPIKGLADLRGMKIRTTNATEGEALRALGMVPILMPVNEVAEAIGRGTIDGTTVHPVPMFDFGLNRVTKYDYFIRLGISPLVVLMNRQKFESLPKAAQAALMKHAGEEMAQVYIKGYGGYSDDLTAKLKADPARHVIEPTAKDEAAAEAAFKPLIDSWQAKDPRNATLYKQLTTIIAQIRSQD